MSTFASRLDAASITLLVAQPTEHTTATLVPVDLDEFDEAIADLKQIAVDAHRQVSDLMLVGIEFAHPEQFDTTVTIADAAACSVIFTAHDNTTIALEQVLLQVSDLATVTVPMTPNDEECDCDV